MHPVFAQRVASAAILNGSFIVNGQVDAGVGRVRGREGGRDVKKEPDVEELWDGEVEPWDLSSQ